MSPAGSCGPLPVDPAPCGVAASASAKRDAGAGPAPAAPLVTLRKRSEFLAAARARRVARSGFVLQARHRAAGEAEGGIRVGYTCSKKVGNAVARNRAKRRLREAARCTLARHGAPGWDYVLIGRARETAVRPFDLLCADLEAALRAVHGSAR